MSLTNDCCPVKLRPWTQRQLCTKGRACKDSQGEGLASVTLEWHREGTLKIEIDAGRQERGVGQTLSQSSQGNQPTFTTSSSRTVGQSGACAFVLLEQLAASPCRWHLVHSGLKLLNHRENHLFLMWAASNVLWEETGFKWWPKQHFCVCCEGWMVLKQMTTKG